MFTGFIQAIATFIGVGVERRAAGYEDTTLDVFIDVIALLFGATVAEGVDGFFDGLIEALGSDLISDAELTVLPPDFEVSNGMADTTTVTIPDGPYIVDIGSAERVGNAELARIILGFVDGDENDSDVQQILSELVTGTSGATLESEFELGLDGVQLTELSRTHYALEIADGAVADTLIFQGSGTETAIEDLNTRADLTDGESRLSLVEVGVEQVELGFWVLNPVVDLVGDTLDAAEDISALLRAAEIGDGRIDLISRDADSVAMRIHNPMTGTWDTFVFYGDEVEEALAPPAPAPDTDLTF